MDPLEIVFSVEDEDFPAQSGFLIGRGICNYWHTRKTFGSPRLQESNKYKKTCSGKAWPTASAGLESCSNCSNCPVFTHFSSCRTLQQLHCVMRGISLQQLQKAFSVMQVPTNGPTSGISPGPLVPRRGQS